MSKSILKLKSADPGVKNIRIPSDLIECYFDIDLEAKNDYELFMEEHQMLLLSWADRASKFIKKSKAVEALSLLEEYNELNEEFFEGIEQEKKRASTQSYSVIKLNSQTMYRVKESLKELDSIYNNISDQEKYGDGFKSYD